MLGFLRQSKNSSTGPVVSEYPNNNNSYVFNETGVLDHITSLGSYMRGNHNSADANEITENMDDDIIGCTSTFHSYCSEWEKLFVRDDYQKSIKSFSMKGGLRSSRFRSVAWKLFLGVLPQDQTLWLSKTEEWRTLYDDLKTKLIINPRNAEAKDLSINNPLSQEVESPWNQFFLDNELRLTIKQDVIRTFPDVPFFCEDSVHDMLMDILFCYARSNPEIQYRQGMHELLAPLIFVLHCDHQAFMHACEIESVGQFQKFQRELAKNVLNPEFLEHDAYALFCQIMQTVESWYVSKETLPQYQPTNVSNDLLTQPFARPLDVHPSNAVVAKLLHIQDDLLKKADSELFDHLIKMDIAPQIYGIRWLRLLFGREFPMQDLLIMWDAIFADDRDFSLVDYVFVVMLLYLRNALLTSDYPSCLRLLMKYPPIQDIQYFVMKALNLRDPEQFPDMISYYHKSPSESGCDGEKEKKGDSIKGSNLAQSLSSLTKISLKRPGSLRLGGSSSGIMSKSTSEPMNLITDTAVTSDGAVHYRKGSTASLSLIEGSLMKDPRYTTGGLKQNPSSQSLAHMEQEGMNSSVADQMSTASSDGGKTSPKTGRFYFFGSRGNRKSSMKAKPHVKSSEQDTSVTPSYYGHIDGTCRRCATELDVHIGTIQRFVLKQNSFEENDEILLALAGIKQVRDVLKGVLKPSDMFSTTADYSVNSYGNAATNQHYRKPQIGSAQSSLAATPMYETTIGKFYVATPDLLSSDTDINSPESGGLYPDGNHMERNESNDTIVAQDRSQSNCDLERIAYTKDEPIKNEATTKTYRRDTRKSSIPLDIKFQKSIPENVLLPEVEMVELQKEPEKIVHDLENKSNVDAVLNPVSCAMEYERSSTRMNTDATYSFPADLSDRVPLTSRDFPLVYGSANQRQDELYRNGSQNSKLADKLKNSTSK